MQRIVTYLWFDDQAEEAAAFYTSLFPNSGVGAVTRYSEAMPERAGTVLTVPFTLDGQEFIALNGGPEFRFTEAISLSVKCETQEEVDRLWAALTEGGEPGPCGWLKDRYGLSWQIVPTLVEELLRGDDPQKVTRMTRALLQMSKLDAAALQAAYEGA